MLRGLCADKRETDWGDAEHGGAYVLAENSAKLVNQASTGDD